MKTHYKIGTYRLRSKEGRFTSLKSRVKALFRRIFQLSFIGLAIYLVFITGRYTQPNEQIFNSAEAEGTLSSRIEELKNDIVSTIRECESQNNPDIIYTFDPDPRQPKKQIASFGQYQYKLKTIVDYYHSLYGEKITERQALDIALDEQKAQQLTKDIAFKDSGKGVNNWYNCAKKHNLVGKVSLIKELE